MKPWKTPLATIAGISVMIAGAHGQTAPTPVQADSSQPSVKQTPKQTPDKKPATADKKSAAADKSQKGAPAKEAPADDSEPAPLYNSLTLDYNTWSSTRYTNGLNQSGKIPGGFGIADLSLLHPYDEHGLASFEFKGVPGDDFGGRFKDYIDPKTSISLNGHQFSFYDPSVGTMQQSRDKGFDATVETQISQNFGAFATYKFEQDEHHYPVPLLQPDFIAREFVLGAQKEFGQHTIGVTVSENGFSDLAQVQPTTVNDHAEARYIGDYGPRLTVEAATGVTRIRQAGQPVSWVRDYGISGVYDVSDSSSLGAHAGQSILELNGVQNAYVRKKTDAGANYQGLLGKWSYAMGYANRQEERLRTDHSYVDVPDWNDYDFKLNGMVMRGIRLGFKGSIEDLTTAPVFQTDDPTDLYWQRKETLQAKLSGGNTNNTGYLSYTEHYRRNDDRELSINWGEFAVGGSRIFSPKLLGFAEFSSDQYVVRGDSTEATPLGTYFPSSETFTVGVDFTRNAHENFSAVINSFYTQDQWGQQIALTYHRDLGKDRNFEITYSPWLQRDRLYDVDTFDARILTIKLGTRF